MGYIHIFLEPEVELALRKQIMKKGDISKIVNEALRKHLKKDEQKMTTKI